MTCSSDEEKARSALGITKKHMKLKEKVTGQFIDILKTVGENTHTDFTFFSISQPSLTFRVLIEDKDGT